MAKKNYLIIENGAVAGHAKDVVLDAKFQSSEASLGVTYLEIPDELGLADITDASIDADLNVVEDTSKRINRETKAAAKATARANLKALDKRNIPPAQIAQVLGDILEALGL